MTESAPTQDMPVKIHSLTSSQLAEEIRIELRRAALQARSSAVRTHGGGGFRARRSQRLYRRFVLSSFVVLVIFPMAYIAAFLWAMPAQYITESRLTVVSQSGPMSGILSNLMGKENSGEAYLINYISSSNIVASLLEVDPGLIEQSGVLKENSVMSAVFKEPQSLERQLKGWGQHVKIERRSFTSTIELSVAALTAASSLELHERILHLAEQHINLVSERQRTTQVSEAEHSLQTAQVTLGDAINRLQEVRQKYNMIDPELEAKQRIGLIYQLERQQADQRQRLEVLKQRTLDNSQLLQVTSQIEALEIQKQTLRQSIAGNVPGTGATVAEAASEMSLFEAGVSTARDDVARRMIQLSEARQTANRQGIFLQNSVSPVLPQTPYRVPKFLYGIIFFAGAIAVWLVTAAMGALIRDHAR